MKKLAISKSGLVIILATLMVFSGCIQESGGHKTVAVASVALNKTEAGLAIGQTVTLTATVSPENAANKKVSWKSLSETVASVSAEGLVSALTTGTAVIVVTTDDGSHVAECTVTVVPFFIPVDSISLEPASVANLPLYSSVTLAAHFLPLDATNKAITWISSDESVATVASGTVTGTGTGTAIITVTTEDGAKTAACPVTITFNTAPYVDTSANIWLYDGFSENTVGGLYDVKTKANATVANGALSYSGTDSGVTLKIKDSLWAAIAAAHASDISATNGGYYVEMMIRPTSLPNENLGVAPVINSAKTAFYYGGLNKNGRIQTGTLAVLKGYQGQSITLTDTMGALCTDTYKIRVEYYNNGTADVVMMYCNDVAIGKSAVANIYSVPALNKIASADNAGFGVYSAGCSYLLDSIKVGPRMTARPNLKIATTDTQLKYMADYTTGVLANYLIYQENAASCYANSDPFTFTVNAFTDAGLAGNFTITSSSPALALSSAGGASGNTVTVTPSAEGTALITITNSDDPASFRKILYTVDKAQIFSASDYGSLTGKVYPAAASVSAYADTELRVTFDAPPVIAPGSSFVIYAADGIAKIDTVKTDNEINTYGDRTNLWVGNQLVYVDGNDLVLIPHNGKLAASTKYVVGIPDGAVIGRINAVDFVGFMPSNAAAANYWSFTTSAAPAPAVSAITAGKNGTESFRTIQSALNYAKTAGGAATITLSDGIYRENITWTGTAKLTVNGTSLANTVIQFQNYNGRNASTDTRALFRMATCGDVTLQNFTIKNSHKRSIDLGANAQAETIYFNDTDSLLVAKNVFFSSEQDTILTKGFNWFYNCVIEGNTDFIWGYAATCLFENSEIRTIGDSKASSPSGGYIVQSRAATGTKGYVFLNCTITSADGIDDRTSTAVATGTSALTFLARSGGDATVFDNVAYINCILSDHIPSVGWANAATTAASSPQPNPIPAVGTITNGFKEYGTAYSPGSTNTTAGRTGSVYVMTTGEYTASYADYIAVFANTTLSDAITPYR